MSERFRFYFNKKFYLGKSGYWIATASPAIQAHRWVWINTHGVIPSKMDIHHVDEDKSNNSIENLKMLSRSDHLKEHWKDPELRAKRRVFLTKIRPKVHEWVRSKEGRKKQSISAKKAWKTRRIDKKNCEQCEIEYMTQTPQQRFCSDACARKWNRNNKIYFIEQICPI
jgi:hypothetical protein